MSRIYFENHPPTLLTINQKKRLIYNGFYYRRTIIDKIKLFSQSMEKLAVIAFKTIGAVLM